MPFSSKSISWRSKQSKKNTENEKRIPFLSHTLSSLKHLNLEKTGLGNMTAIKIIEFARKSIKLESLNLSDNHLSDEIALPVIETVNGNLYLRELYLRWNGLTAKFGSVFFSEIKSKSNLKVLDLSWNSLGKGLKVIKPPKKGRRNRNQVAELAPVLQEFLEEDKYLIHIDLSCNGFRYEECEMIQAGLSKNHTIYGFHFEGNYGYVDSEQFLVLEGLKKDFSSGQSMRQIRGVDKIKHYNKLAHQVNPSDARNVCWICDGWIEMKFEFTGSKKTKNLVIKSCFISGLWR